MHRQRHRRRNRLIAASLLLAILFALPVMLTARNSSNDPPPRRAGIDVSSAGVSSTPTPTDTSPTGTAERAAPTRTMQPDPSPTTECISVDQEPLYAPQDPAPITIVGSADLIVIGRIVASLPAQWTTPDGLPPAGFDLPDLHRALIVTPYILEIDGPLISDRSNTGLPSPRIVVLSMGGSDGCIEMGTSAPHDTFRVGERVMVALYARGRLADAPDAVVQTPAGVGWWSSYRWELRANGEAISPWSTRPAADVIAELRAAAATLPTPTPIP